MSIIPAPDERIGARERVLGKTRFGFDQGREGDLFLALVRAEQGPARITRLDPSRAEALAGVVRVFTAADVPGTNRLGIIPTTKDQEFLAQEMVKHQGQAVALVAAQTREAAAAGARAVELELEGLTGVHDPLAALEPGAALVHPDREGGNLLLERNLIKGDAETALEKCAVRFEAEYTTSHIEHTALECEGGRAEIVDGRLVIAACTQNPHYDRNDVALFLGLKPDQVRIIQAETGGGFGGKLDVSVQPYLGLAAWLLKRPVRLAYTREESILATGKRHPFRIRYASGSDEQGLLRAVKVDLVADTGAFASYGLAVCLRAMTHATGPYFVPHVRVRSRMAYTNNPWAGAMRGFGVPQVAFAHESQMDGLADALGIDRLEFRLKNALRQGQATATGQVLQRSVGLVQCLERIKPIYETWKEKIRSGPGEEGRLQGIGLGAMYYGIGNTGVPNPSTAQVEWTPDNRIILYTGAADIGQGSDTVLVQLAAKRLGLPPERLELVRGDTDLTTDAGASSASRQTYISGNAVLEAAADLERIILEEASEALEIHVRDLEMEGEEIRAKGSPGHALGVVEALRRMAVKGKKAKGQGRFDPDTTGLDPKTGQGSPYAAYAFAAQAAWAEVDPASAMVRVKKIAAVHDVGKAVNKRAVIGQICGGVMMGLGMALMEEFEPGQTTNLQNYHIPTAADAPRIEPMFVESQEDSGPYGAKGVGEPALIPTAPAVASAVGQALGRPMRHLPLNLERVMSALVGDDRERFNPEDCS